MKAKEYIAAYRERDSSTLEQARLAVSWLLLEMMKEALALAMHRSGVPRPPDRVLIPITREFDLKWRAVAREIDHINPNGWKEFWSKRGITW